MFDYKAIYHTKVLISLSFLVFISAQNIYGQNASSPLWGNLGAGEYEVGFKVFNETDFTRRSYKKSGDQLIATAREIKVSVWYPAQMTKKAAQQSKMRFSEYILAADRQKQTANLPIAQELSAPALAKLMQTETAAIKNAPFFKGEKFPVIVFGQGLFYESPTSHTILCEFLASRGFIVATTTLFGAHSPFVKLDAVDLEAAVRDLEFVAARARAIESADLEKLAVIGFDMGGLAGVIFAMRNSQTDAYASLDSGILAEHNLLLLKRMPDYDPLRLRMPLFHATHPVGELVRFNVNENSGFIDAAHFSERLILRFPNVRHADFTSIPMIESVIAKMRDEQTTHRRRSFETVAQNLLAFLQTNLHNKEKNSRTPEDQANVQMNSKIKFTQERKPALGFGNLSEDEFINHLYWEGAESTTNLYRKQQAQFPNEPIFREETLDQIGYNRLYRGESSEAIRIFKLNVEAFPKSSNVYYSLAEAYRMTGNMEQAKINYRISLQINPDSEKTKNRLKDLDSKK